MGWGSIGKIVGGVASAAGSLLGANQSAKASKQNTATQVNWEREQAQNRIQWAVQDAIRAGVNPGVAVGQAPGVSGISPSMPDTSGYQQAGQSFNTAIQLMQKQQEVDAKSQLDRATARQKDVETGLKPKEVAIEESKAETERMNAETMRQEAFARIQEIMVMLPGKTEIQKQEIMQNMLQLALQTEQTNSEIAEEKANQKILKISGGYVSLKDMKAVVAGLAGAGAYHYEQEKNRNSAGQIARDRNIADMEREKYRNNASMERERYKESQKRHIHKRVYTEHGYDDYNLR